MTGVFTAACIQINAGPEIAPNLAILEDLIREAATAGADLILTPESSDLIEPHRASMLHMIRPEADHAGLRHHRALATELGRWILVGSFLLAGDPGDPDGRARNRSFLIDPQGGIAARYDKIHMFDVEIADGQSYRESRRFAPGDRAVLAALPWGTLGLTICYDLRFPGLYRALAEAGALFLTAPSAFTRKTGDAHWHCLLRARAIETGSYLLAAAQCGTHARGRETYGHSLIVSPWGEVLADGGTEPGIVFAEIDPARALEARRAIPALAGGRRFRSP